MRAAVVGAGLIGRLHARVYDRDPRTNLVGLVEKDKTTAESISREFSTTVYESVEELISKADPEIVSIAVPEDARLAPAVVAAQAGCHLLLEKPLGPTLQQSNILTSELKTATGTVMVNYILRSDIRYLRVREAVLNGDIGRVYSFNSYRRSTTSSARRLQSHSGLLISTAIHDIDAMTWIAGAPVERVYAEASTSVSSGRVHEDSVVATLRFANGIIGSLDTSWILPSSFPVRHHTGFQVIGDEGVAEIRGTNSGVSMVTNEGLALPDLTHWPTSRDGVEGSLRASISHFIDCVEKQSDPVMTLREAVAAEAVVGAIQDSVRREAPVVPKE